MLIKKEDILDITGTIKASEALDKLRSSDEFRKKFEQRFSISLPADFLMHGSTSLLEMLETNVSDGGSNANKTESLVYTTDNPDYAIFLAIIDLKDNGRAGVVFDKNNEIPELSINTQFINGESKIIDGYVHILEGSSFVPNANREFTSNVSIKPLCIIPVSAKDLQQKIIVK